MKKINFGFSNDNYPTGSWEGIGRGETPIISNADYYGAFTYEGNHYIVSKIVDDEFDMYPEKLNTFIVDPACLDLYADGSFVLFSNQEKDHVANFIENYLNQEGIREKVNNINDVYNFCNGAYPPNHSFKLLGLNGEILSTAIRDDVFNRINTSINECTSSISQLNSKENAKTL